MLKCVLSVTRLMNLLLNAVFWKVLLSSCVTCRADFFLGLPHLHTCTPTHPPPHHKMLYSALTWWRLKDLFQPAPPAWQGTIYHCTANATSCSGWTDSWLVLVGLLYRPKCCSCSTIITSPQLQQHDAKKEIFLKISNMNNCGGKNEN